MTQKFVVGVVIFIMTMLTSGSLQTHPQIDSVYVSQDKFSGTKYAFNQGAYRQELRNKGIYYNRRAPFPKTFESTLRLELQGICSGTAVGPRVILTAAHCVNKNPLLKVNGELKVIKKIIVDKTDHAFIVLADTEAPFEKMAQLGQYPKIGDDIFYWGNPDGLEQMFRKGYISAIMPDGYIADINTWMGDSGAGVFDEDGRLIGVISMILGRTNPKAGGLGYKFMAFLPYSFTKEQLAEVEFMFECKKCKLTQ